MALKLGTEQQTIEEFKDSSSTGSSLKINSTKNDFTSSLGLYKIAKNNGLQKDADRIVSLHSGEKVKEIFSGGFISDFFDVLNAAQYGTVGLLTGKGFSEGVRTRASFSDKDSLGDNGIPGVIAGIALDMAVDPLTYIAPWTILKKIPGLTTAAKFTKEFAFGRVAEQIIESSPDLAELGGRTFQKIEGGTKIGKKLGEAFVWMFGADPIFKEVFERKLVGDGKASVLISEIIKPLAKFDDNLASKLIKRGADDRINRISIDNLMGALSKEEMDIVAPVWNKIDELSKEQVRLGILSKNKMEEGIGEYFKNSYDFFEEAEKKGLGFGGSKLGVSKQKGRVEGLTKEAMEELGQIKNPAFLAFNTMLRMSRDVENAKLFKTVAERFGTDIAQDGFIKLPEAARLSFKAGEKADILSGIKKINESTKPLLKELKHTFKADSALLKEITSIENDLKVLGSSRADELFRFFNEGQEVTKATSKARKIGTIPQHLQILANDVKKFKNFDDMVKSDIGIKVEKLFTNGDLERAGFRKMEDFFKSSKGFFEPAGVGEVTTKLKGNIPKIISLQKRIEDLGIKSGVLSDINKTSINDSFINLEKQLSDFAFQKEELAEAFDKALLGDLAGKYVPENIFNNIQDIITPTQNKIGKKIVSEFKFMKVLMSPGTHLRNTLSNRILNYWKLGINPLDIRLDIEVGKAMKEGSKNKWIKEAMTVGYGADTFAANELGQHLGDKIFTKTTSKIKGFYKKAQSKIGDIYEKEENWAKLSAFINKRKKGASIEEAWKMAESATFNYAHVTPMVRKLRTEIWGVPFITFPIKATPLAIETTLKNPNRISIIGKIKRNIEAQSDIKELERERASEPQWIKDGFYVKMPFKDKNGRSSYFDLTYIIPFGDLISGQIFQRQTKRDTGLVESVPEALLSKSPLFNFIKEISRNQDFSGNKIWKDSDSVEKQIGDLTRHVTKSFVPPAIADQIPGGYNRKGERQQSGVARALKLDPNDPRQQRSLQQTLLRYVGLSVLPRDAELQEATNEWDRRRALKTMLREKNIIDGTELNYISKEKKKSVLKLDK